VIGDGVRLQPLRGRPGADDSCSHAYERGAGVFFFGIGDLKMLKIYAFIGMICFILFGNSIHGLRLKTLTR
jgi:hypothetical protein